MEKVLANNKIKTRLIFFSSISFILISSLFILNKSVNILWADEWDTPGNLLIKEINNPQDVGFKDFFSQHNESRKFFPKLFYYITYKAGFFDTRIGVVFRLFISLLSILLLFHTIKKNDTIDDSFKILIICLFVFIPTQAYNQIFGLQFITAIPSFCIIFIIFINKHLRNINVNLLLTFFLCFFSTFSYSNGIIIWVICNPIVFHILKITHFKKWHFLIFNITFISVVLLYFADYQHPAHHPGFQEGLSEPLRALKYFSLWLFSPFLIGTSYPVLVSSVLTVIFFIFILLIITKITKEFKSTKTLGWDVVCGLMLVIYSLTSCTIASLGRSGFGYMAAHGPQYPSFALWSHLGIFLLIFSKYLNFHGQIKNFFISSYFLLYLFSIEAGLTSFGSWNQKMNQAKLTVENLDICPNNSLISEFHPSPSSIRKKSNSFDKAGIINYQRNYWIKTIEKKDALFPGESGWVTISKSENTLHFIGWASIPISKKPADYILIGVHDENRFIPLTFISPHISRPDVQNALKMKTDTIYGFHKTIELPTQYRNLRPYCYSVSKADQKYFKLSEI